MNKQEYVNSLRELADYIESRSFPDTWRVNSWNEDVSYIAPYMQFVVNNKKVFSEIVSNMGAFDKKSTDWSVSATHELPSGSMVSVIIDHEQICEKVVVGKKVVPFREAYLVQAEPEHEEDIVEWKCPDSFLALKDNEDNKGE